jgi:hypothetical protein
VWLKTPFAHIGNREHFSRAGPPGLSPRDNPPSSRTPEQQLRRDTQNGTANPLIHIRDRPIAPFPL